MLKSKFRIIIFLFAVVSFVVPLVLLAAVVPYYRVNSGSIIPTESAYDAVTRYVKNNSTNKDYFIPNNTASEWLAFTTNKPSDLEYILACSAGTICGNSCFVNTGLETFIYDTVQVGSGSTAQCWMTENLKTRYNYAGSPITQWNYGVGATFTNRFACMGTSNSCPDSELFYQPLSALAAASYLPTGSTSQGVQGICPSGWRIPSEADRNQLASLTGCASAPFYHFSESCLNFAGLDINKYGYRAGSMGTTYNAGQSAQFLLTNRNYVGNKWVYSLMHVSYESASANEINGYNIRCMKGGSTGDWREGGVVPASE